MHNELTNLLPAAARHAARREYLLRLGVVAALLATALVIVAALLLLPAYVFLGASFQTKKAHLASIESTLSSVSEKTLSDRLAALSTDAATLTAIANAPSISAIIRAVLATARPGVSLSSFVYTPAAPGSHGTLLISGMAMTRDALRNYQLTLQSAPFALAADLPVSAYAQDTNIPFTITVTLAP